MNHRASKPMIALALSAGLLAAQAAQASSKADVRCELTYSVKGWSAFYKTAEGKGVITCDNGQSASVEISVKGGGVTFGKSEIVDGKGTFTGVKDIQDVYGSYGTAEAHAGAVESAGAQAMTKGNVSLALAGTGKGVDLGVAFGKFEIQPAVE